MLQVLDGLAAIHTRGFVHRDDKPSNVFVSERGVAKVIDLGNSPSLMVPTAWRDPSTGTASRSTSRSDRSLRFTKTRWVGMPLPMPRDAHDRCTDGDPNLRTLRNRTTESAPARPTCSLHDPTLSRSIPLAMANEFVTGNSERLRIGVQRKQHPSSACSRSRWHPHGFASSDHCDSIAIVPLPAMFPTVPRLPTPTGIPQIPFRAVAVGRQLVETVAVRMARWLRKHGFVRD